MWKNIARNQWQQLGVEILLFLLLLPVLWLLYPSSLDWGDDFALYLLQAKSYWGHETNLLSQYLFNEANPLYSPERYPPVYALILSGWAKIKGFEFSDLIQLQSWLLITWGLLTYFFLRKEHPISAILVAILMVYFPYCIELKNELLADFAFCVLALGSIHGSLSRHKLTILFAGLLAAFALLTKPLGIFLIASFSLHFLVAIVFTKDRRITSILYYYTGFVIGILILFPFTSQTQTPLLAHFGHIVSNQDIWTNIRENLTIYQDLLLREWNRTSSDWSFLRQWSHHFLVTFSLLGILISYSKKWNLIHVYFLFLSLFILVFPNSKQGLRYVLPLFPLLAYFILTAGHSLLHKHPTLKRGISLALFLSVFLLVEKNALTLAWNNRTNTIETLDSNPSSQLLFSKISSLDSGSVICFKKARALVLYTNRKSFCNKIENSIARTEQEMTHFNPTHFLTGRADVLYNPALDAFLENEKDQLDTVFTNSEYTLLTWKK